MSVGGGIPGSAEILAYVSAVGSLATAIGVLLTWQQLRHARRQSQTSFEDALAREYREIALRLPLGALLWEEIDLQGPDVLKQFYHYFDLSNEQVFLRQNRRVSKPTWISWSGGIQSNLARPAFQKAWAEIKERSRTDFQELRRLEKSAFREDPVSWGRTTA